MANSVVKLQKTEVKFGQEFPSFSVSFLILLFYTFVIGKNAEFKAGK